MSNASLETFDPDEPGRGEYDPRGSLIAELIGPDPVRRREALRVARERRWLDPLGDVSVRAVLIEEPRAAVPPLQHALTVAGRGHTLVIADGDGVVLVTSTARTPLDIDEWARETAARAGVRLIAPIGSARLRTDEDDLRRAADDARATSELLLLVGESAIGTTRAENLGMWRLLHGMTRSPSLVAAASPAAHELWRSPDQTRRTTVEAYLDAGCSVAVACRALFIHRTTLYYRLESMSEVVRDALADGLQRSTLHLGLKLLQLWDATDGSDQARSVEHQRGTATITRLAPRQASKTPIHSML